MSQGEGRRERERGKNNKRSYAAALKIEEEALNQGFLEGRRVKKTDSHLEPPKGIQALVLAQ